jgi:hypothetical protein
MNHFELVLEVIEMKLWIALAVAEMTDLERCYSNNSVHSVYILVESYSRIQVVALAHS